MKIELIRKKVASLSLQPVEDDSNPNKKRTAKVTLNNEIYANIKDPSLFRIRYDTRIDIDKRLRLELTYDFDFKMDTVFSEEVSKSEKMRSLVPSMAYPYIKTYAEQIISMSGFGNFNLPYFDFYNSPLEFNDKE